MLWGCCMIKRTKDTATVKYEDIVAEFERIHDADIYQMAFDKLIDIDEDGYHEVMKILAKKYNFIYERILK